MVSGSAGVFIFERAKIKSDTMTPIFACYQFLPAGCGLSRPCHLEWGVVRQSRAGGSREPGSPAKGISRYSACGQYWDATFSRRIITRHGYKPAARRPIATLFKLTVRLLPLRVRKPVRRRA
jgi:hypothetical protein